MFTRREFLGRGTAGVSALVLGGSLPGLLARAAAAAEKNGQSDRVLVVIELAGGNDGLNTLIPLENDLYYKNRPKLAIAKSGAIRLNDELALHPGMKPLAELFKQGKLSIAQGVGYPEPDRSHFRSMEIWHTASTGPSSKTTGWLGRLLDQQLESRERQRPEDLAGVALTDTLPQALQAEHSSAPVIQSLEGLDEAGGQSAQAAVVLRELSEPQIGTSGAAAFIGLQAEGAFQIRQRLINARARYRSAVTYPEGDLGAQLRRAAQILAGDLDTRVIFASLGGFDTHSNQADQHGALLAHLAGSLFAFQQDLEQLKLADRVVTIVFSEFGRRVDENSSGGTDHGAASCLFALGSQVQGGLVGKYPSLEKLGDGDLIFNTDFRSVYATLLDRWLLASSAGLLGGKFEHLPLLKTKLG
ncbi:MAG TPA: DUF1501 domain-containing protein [Pirellulales bacterium]|jgi:uncharacterized protein (DUF1501 family)|nr:DUF1501 domain-containing protein [Pirellulales bacterium]